MTMAASMNEVELAYQDFLLGPIHLEIEPGTALALIGPNGAGKSTLMDLLAGMVRPSVGHVSIHGHEVDGPGSDWRNLIGYVSEKQPFYERWTVRRNLQFLHGFYPAWSSGVQDDLVTRFRLPMDKPVRTLSKGNRVKLALVAAMSHQPKLLLLDEPTSGLDPLIRAELLDVLWTVLEDGERTILYSTHNLSDVHRVADELVFIDSGQIVLRAGSDSLANDWRQISFRLAGKQLPSTVLGSFSSHQHRSGRHLAVTSDYEQSIDQLRAFGATDIEVNRLSLEEVSVAVLKQHAGGQEAAHV